MADFTAIFADDIVFDAPKPTIAIPEDDFSSPPAPQGTIFYLTISTPSTDTWDWHGPCTSFAQLSLLVHHAVANVSSAVAKLSQALETKSIAENGFSRFVIVPPRRSDFVVLEVIREFNPGVSAALPLPVFTVLSHGPLLHDVDAALGRNRLLSADAKGWASTSKIVGSFTERKEARAVAEQTMKDLLASEEEAVVPQEAFPPVDAGAGLIMAMNHRAKWEVRVFFSTDTLHGAVSRFGEEERNVEKENKASYGLSGS